MVSMLEIGWVAAILDGEGCFTLSNKKSPGCIAIDLVSCDIDIILKFRKITKCPNQIQASKRNSKYWKTSYRIRMSGSLSVQWAMTIYPIMSTRRKAKIAELLNGWKNSQGSGAHNRWGVVRRVS